MLTIDCALTMWEIPMLLKIFCNRSLFRFSRWHLDENLYLGNTKIVWFQRNTKTTKINNYFYILSNIRLSKLPKQRRVLQELAAIWHIPLHHLSSSTTPAPTHFVHFVYVAHSLPHVVYASTIMYQQELRTLLQIFASHQIFRQSHYSLGYYLRQCLYWYWRWWSNGI